MTNVKCQMNVCLRHLFYKLIIPAFVIFNLSLLITVADAATKDLIINGDNVSYDKENQLVEATGSVEVIYQEVKLYGQHIVYNTASDEVLADQGFSLIYEGISIEGQTVDYNIVKKSGQAKQVKFIYGGVNLSGKKLDFSFDEFDLRDASFSTCDLRRKHYKVTAKQIILYPSYGWIVSYWAWFWFEEIPVLPMPTYIYDMLADERSRRNIPPFPEVGSNDDDGTYIREKLAWHLNRNFFGSYSLTYADKKGFGGGVEADYIVNEDVNGNVRLSGNAGDGYWGGFTHRVLFGQAIEEPDSGPNFFQLPKQKRYELETNYSYRERINYERVSKTPEITFKSKQGRLLASQVKYDGQISAGWIKEENGSQLGLAKAGYVFYQKLPTTKLGIFTPSLGFDNRYYSNGGKWTKYFSGLRLDKKITANFELGLGHLHYFSINGTSPFNYELYRFKGVDRFISDWTLRFGKTGLQIHTSHYLDDYSPEDIDYLLLLGMHCYNLTFQYRSLRNEFSLGFGILEE